MDYRVLYRKYRPENFLELIGQDNIRDLLLNSIINNKISHAYIFTGPRGTGKTSTAKIFAKTVNCENLSDNIPCEKCSFCLSYEDTSDIIEIDAASNNGVDEIRELRENIKILPNNSKYKIYIIDEVHMLSNSAWNAFLKTLEEPPSHVIFILATTEIQKVPITVLSRCQRFDFQRISEEKIESALKNITDKEQINITIEAITEISKISDGGLRDALSILDQLSKTDKKIDIDTLKQIYGIVTENEIKLLFDLYLSKDVEQVITTIDKFNNSGVDANILISKMLDYLLNSLIENKINKQNEFNNLEILIESLEECYYKSNKYLLIKAILLTNININNDIINSDSTQNNFESNTEQIISREIILQEPSNANEIKISDEIMNVRINNSFVNAQISLKKEFIKTWENFIKKLYEKNELKLESLLKDSKVEVVSPTNMLLSTSSYSNSILLNSLSDEISLHLHNEYNISIKIICLDIVMWNEVKKDYIKNKKIKNYELMVEPDNNVTDEVINKAEKLFGDDLVQIN